MQSSTQPIVRSRLALVLVVVVSLAVGCGGGVTPSPAASSASPAASSAPPDGSAPPSEAPSEAPGLTELTPVTYYVGGVTSSAPQDYSGEAQGIFAKYNLDPEFVVLDGTSQAVQAVAAHREGFAYTQGSILDEMLIADNNPDAPALLAIASMAPLNPVAVLYLEDTGISTPADLVGKTIGVPTGSLSETYLNVFLEREGIATDSVTIQNIGFAALHPALLQGQVDAIAEFARGIASMEVVAAEENRSVGYFLFGEYDIPSPLTAVVTQKRVVDENPAVAQAIANVTTEALHFCVVDPEQCIRDFVDLNEGRDYDATLAEWNLALEAQYGLDAATVQDMEPGQLGWFDADLVANAVPELSEVFGVEQTFDPTTLYTNQFVQQP
jgi:NitT/TauT family transport system substrate-binding protein